MISSFPFKPSRWSSSSSSTLGVWIFQIRSDSILYFVWPSLRWSSNTPLSNGAVIQRPSVSCKCGLQLFVHSLLTLFKLNTFKCNQMFVLRWWFPTAAARVSFPLYASSCDTNIQMGQNEGRMPTAGTSWEWQWASVEKLECIQLLV